MSDAAARALAAWVGAFADELARAGVRDVCVAPGSRSTPLATALARHDAVRVWMHLDERSAAFFALGMAKWRGAPVALLCTSGTAAANFLPAVAEARQGRVALVVLTADRPPELRDVGAPQTIDQTRLYGAHAKWFVEAPLPDASPELLRHARALAGRAAALAAAAPAGPVHLNFPFREPLVPVWDDEAAAAPVGAGGADAAIAGRAGGAPWVRVSEAPRAPDAALAGRLADALLAARRPVIVCGPQDDAGLAAPLAALAERLGAPVLADPLSQVRWGDHPRGPVLDAYDAFLRDAATATRLAPDLVLRIGAVPTSKPVLQWLAGHPAAHVVVVDAAGWPDPTHAAAEVVHAEPRLLCEAVLRCLAAGGEAAGGEAAGGQRAARDATRAPGGRGSPPAGSIGDGTGLGGTIAPPGGADSRGGGPIETVAGGPAAVVTTSTPPGANARGGAPGVNVAPGADAARTGAPPVGTNGGSPATVPAAAPSWLAAWRASDARARQALDAHADCVAEPFEGRVLRDVAAALPDGATLWVSSSMPVRDLDAFAAGDRRALRVLANRGANGIDGVVSSALGAAAAAADAAAGPLALVVGDLAFYHDMNGLLAARLHTLDATIVLVNNDGGGIFSFLPQARALPAARFERLFGTPHGLDFRPAAELYGATYARADAPAELAAALAVALARPGLDVVEVRTDRARNVALHREAWEAVAAAFGADAPGATTDVESVASSEDADATPARERRG